LWLSGQRRASGVPAASPILDWVFILVIPPRIAYFYQPRASNPVFLSRINQIEALKRYEEVIESSWRLLPGCAVIQPCLGLSTPATRNGHLYRRPSGNRRARGSLGRGLEDSPWPCPLMPTTLTLNAESSSNWHHRPHISISTSPQSERPLKRLRFTLSCTVRSWSFFKYRRFMS
jgi:hypothetical protein